VFTCVGIPAWVWPALIGHPGIHGHLPRFSAVCCRILLRLGVNHVIGVGTTVNLGERGEGRGELPHFPSLPLSFHPVHPLPVPQLSARCHQLSLPRVRRSTFGTRVFCVAGPAVWNSLPDHLRDPAVDSEQFLRELKTYLFAGHWKR